MTDQRRGHLLPGGVRAVQEVNVPRRPAKGGLLEMFANEKFLVPIMGGARVGDQSGGFDSVVPTAAQHRFPDNVDG